MRGTYPSQPAPRMRAPRLRKLIDAPFGDSSMEPFDAANPFAEFTKLFEQFKLPGFDVPAVMEARRKDVEALIAAHQTAMQGMQALAQKQAEKLRTTLTELQSLASKQAAAG